MFFFFFFNDTATTEIYTLSLHDALPICSLPLNCSMAALASSLVDISTKAKPRERPVMRSSTDRKSTRLNSSHSQISYAVFCLKKKKESPCHLYTGYLRSTHD